MRPEQEIPFACRRGVNRGDRTSEKDELRLGEEEMSLANVIEVLCLIAIVILTVRFVKMRSRNR